jgi:DNA-binding XRE family transcriptional regulator
MARSRRQRAGQRSRKPPASSPTPTPTPTPGGESSLGALRRDVGLTQVGLAEKLSASQRTVSHVEHEPNPRVGTLAGYVEALGGRLELRAVFKDRSVALRLKDRP